MSRLLSCDGFSAKHFIAFDTNIITDFKNPNMNSVANELKRASKREFRFVLPDLCLAEALNFFDARDPISPNQWANMVRNLKKFIWREFPVLPSRKDLYFILGVRNRPDDQSAFSDVYSRALFNFFCKYPSVKDQEANRRKELQEELEKARNHWRTLIDDIRMGYQMKTVANPRWSATIAANKLLTDYGVDLDSTFQSGVPLSERRALALECAVNYACQPDGHGGFCYDQYSVNNMNDGIDYLIMDVLMLGVTICSNDKFFTNAKSRHRKDNVPAGRQLSLCKSFKEVLDMVSVKKS